MAGGLVAGYGTLAAMAGRFLYPSEDDTVGWQYVATVDELQQGESLVYVSPVGAKVVIARQSPGDHHEAFVALSSVCPHLGCQVHWEPHNDRFFCPCHNGAFDPQGRPTEGPPAAANQQLTRFRLKVEDGLLFVLAPLRSFSTEA
jgi:Rieske Fe-S protein